MQKNNNFYVDNSLKNFTLETSQLKNSSYHLFSHGKSGELYINNRWLNKEGIYQFLRNKLADKKELLIYGCEFAKGEQGIEAINYLEDKLHVKISASTNVTGINGDWILEY